MTATRSSMASSGLPNRDNGEMHRVRRLLPLVVAIWLVTLSAAACEGAALPVGVPIQPADTTVPTGPGLPPVSDAARAAGFVDVRTVVPAAIIDLRYATTNNFTHTHLYPSDARCLVH